MHEDVTLVCCVVSEEMYPTTPTDSCLAQLLAVDTLHLCSVVGACTLPNNIGALPQQLLLRCNV